MPEHILEMSTADPLSATPSWVVLSDSSSRKLRSFSTSRKRQGDLGRWEAGTATFTLANLDRAVEPFFSGSPFYPYVVPKRRIRVRTASYPVWDGFIDGWAPTYPGGQDAITTVRATDLFKNLALTQMQNPYVREVRLDAPYAYYRLQESSGAVVAADSSGNSRNGTYATSGVTFSQPDPITDDVDGAITLAATAHMEFPLPMAAGVARSIECWFKTAAVASAQRIVGLYNSVDGTAFFVGMDNTGRVLTGGDGGTTSSFSPAQYDDDAWHHVVATYDGTNTRLYVDGSLVDGPDAATLTYVATVGRIGRTPDQALAWAGSVDEVAVYLTALSATDVSAHYDARNALINQTTDARVNSVATYANVPTALRSVSTGKSSLTSAGNMATQKALDAMRDAETTEAGALFVSRDGLLTFLDRYAPQGGRTRSTTSQVTFGDQPGEVGYQALTFSADDEDLANEITVSRRNGGTFVAVDTAAQTKYGTLSKSVQSVGNSDTEAQSLANWYKTHLADPTQLRVKSMTFLLDGVNDAYLLDREMHDRVTVNWTPPGGGARISQEALVTGLSWQASGLSWQLTMDVSPTEAQQYWVWGVSRWGVDTRWGF